MPLATQWHGQRHDAQSLIPWSLSGKELSSWNISATLFEQRKRSKTVQVGLE